MAAIELTNQTEDLKIHKEKHLSYVEGVCSVGDEVDKNKIDFLRYAKELCEKNHLHSEHMKLLMEEVFDFESHSQSRDAITANGGHDTLTQCLHLLNLHHTDVYRSGLFWRFSSASSLARWLPRTAVVPARHRQHHSVAVNPNKTMSHGQLMASMACFANGDVGTVTWRLPGRSRWAASAKLS